VEYVDLPTGHWPELADLPTGHWPELAELAELAAAILAAVP
jgi:hypothetical protein